MKLLSLNRRTGETGHFVFNQLEELLRPGDAVILNNSRTIPAQLTGKSKNDEQVIMRLAKRVNEDTWKVLLIGEKTWKQGDTFRFNDHVTAVISERQEGHPLVTMKFSICCQELWNEFYKQGEPIRYEYIHVPWELDYYQTVFATVPSSVEMPSAGRAFSWELIQKLRKKNIQIGFVQLHTGLSYYEDDHLPHIPSDHIEEYFIPLETADFVTQLKQQGGRVIAVGTTVVRALESVYAKHKKVQEIHDQTNLYITQDFKLQLVDGLITDLHEPEASHLDLLLAFIQQDFLQSSYEEAIQKGYLWHELGI
ncbi:S-adenosylmethionine:tRNA ribosyltransferase-isomerase [Bacillus horti]|uniref:S-adenosylmethionine:tRNA ribosyltransferase-isomerase n=1 Tax=Caldalkalibacillus horti TaxID=77523 RepID=A0ABT9VX14_9BACI|nr:S-adenosylmethionine:tRNA ribosyltransferase-isomerase [Bacillus horti]MDQ0165535.1 S-adenosylmethionine:tRNA ribosyltransferase-isomerase [Bacillus horti]